MLAIVKLPRLLLIPLALLLTASSPLQPATAKSPAKKSAPKAKAGGSAKAPAKGTASPAAAKRRGAGKAAPVRVRPATQQQPDPQRIREIQEALSAKGYPVEANGVWGPETIQALSKFQEDQNINNLSGRGKLDSLTLIALGLGPQHGTQAPPASQETKTVTEGKNP